MTLPRVAILGGGVASVTAALELSKPGWQQHYSAITLYQQGWRLGGKGASGRGQDDRIEEHGLHIWFGFYENAFRVMREVHDELDALANLPAKTARKRWPLAFTSVKESFEPAGPITLTDHDGCCWSPWVADFFDFDDDRPWLAEDPRTPGERPEDWGAIFYASRCLHLAADLASSLASGSDPTAKITAGAMAQSESTLGTLADLGRGAWAALDGDVQQALGAAAEVLDQLAAQLPQAGLLLDALEVVLRALDLALGFLRGMADELVRSSDDLRRTFYVVDLMVAIARGLLEDGVLEDGFAAIDHWELRDWLRAHGAAQESVDCAVIRTCVYDLAFAYEGGDPSKPSCGAGTALHGLLRSFFTYRGAMMYKMNSGMGDIVFAPMYELLYKRGVDVEFFHRVEAVRLENGVADEIEIDVQATVEPGTTPAGFLYDPADGIPEEAKALWPNAPTVSLQNATGAKAPTAETYESWYAGRAAARVATKKLKRGAKDGFDVVVFGLPIACVPLVAPDLPAKLPRWADAVKHVKTVPTQAMQLWLDKPASELSDHADGIVLGGYTEPYDTWADMSHLMSEEKVAGAKTVAYFCNVLADAAPPVRGQADAWLKTQNALVREQALRFLRRDIAELWPHAVDPFTGVLDWNRLIAPKGLAGEARLGAQYLRANVEPSERYTLSVPGSAAHRIAPGDTGVPNLFAAGDWTACHINAGCVEAAAISGLLAANAVHEAFGDPANAVSIIGYPTP